METKPKILMAMSGGVDSSVAALILKRQGYDLVGAFMKVWSGPDGDDSCWVEDRRDALRVAALLDIPLVTLDFEDEYRRDVMANLFDEYAAGRTPNPDVRCNATVKFPLLWREAQRIGCTALATGHYARVSRSSPGQEWTLLRGVDEEKDQTYFLHRLTQDDLAHTIFPVGGLTKSRVRELAREAGLPNAAKRSTRGICFVGKVDLPEFLGQTIESRPGKVATPDGRVVGDHEGLATYTIGQRRRIGAGGGEPYYVVSKNTETNTLVVAPAAESVHEVSVISLGDVHWVGREPALPADLAARIRYRQPLQSCRTDIAGNHLRLTFTAPQRGVAAGQSVVFHDGDRCLGGGIIDRDILKIV